MMETEIENTPPKKPRKPRLQKAVIDRIEEGKWAVLLVGSKQTEKVIPVEELPEGAKAGSWLKLRVVDDSVQDIRVDEVETAVTRGRIASKLDLLRSRSQYFKPINAAEVQDGSNTLQNPPPAQEQEEGGEVDG